MIIWCLKWAKRIEIISHLLFIRRGSVSGFSP